MQRRAFTATILALSLPLSGCASAPVPCPDRTGGITLDLFVKSTDKSFARYGVCIVGSLSYSGGFDAVNADPSWMGTLTDEEISQLRQLLAEHGWFERVPVMAGPAEGDIEYRIDIHGPKGAQRMKLKGPNEHVEPVRKLLETAARRRFEPILESLPKPGLQQ